MIVVNAASLVKRVSREFKVPQVMMVNAEAKVNRVPRDRLVRKAQPGQWVIWVKWATLDPRVDKVCLELGGQRV